MTSTQIDSGYHKIRRFPRYKGAIPVILEHGKGITRDYSTAGVYFLTEGYYTPGETLSFTLVFNHHPDGRPMQVQCRGTVLRTDLEEQQLGVAVKVNNHTFAL
jgi:hypothetical protein